MGTVLIIGLGFRSFAVVDKILLATEFNSVAGGGCESSASGFVSLAGVNFR